MSWLLHLFIFYFLSFFTSVQAYAIDEVSCSGNQKAVMELGVAEAFLLAQDGLQALDNGVQNQDVGRLATLLFGANADLNSVMEAFAGIVGRNQRINPNDARMRASGEVV